MTYNEQRIKTMTKLSTPMRLRFAPSPTGALHLGGARTALFNWLIARQQGGSFYIRMEDTDKKRSLKEFEDNILEGLSWLGLHWDGDVVYQSHRKERHKEVAQHLLDQGSAYYCECPPASESNANSKTPCSCRNATLDSGAVRLKRPLEGSTIFQDVVYGSVEVSNAELDDMVLLRANGDPTYLLGVAVDDFDMGITHVVRGVDHLTNTTRQMQIFHALGWPTPIYVHLPLIHGEDGKKLSKRHGACNVLEFRELGFIPEGICNALVRMGWGSKGDETLACEQMLQLFDMNSLSKSSARFDMKKLYHFNQYHMQRTAPEKLLAQIDLSHLSLNEHQMQQAQQLIPSMIQRAKTLTEIAQGLKVLTKPDNYSEVQLEGMSAAKSFLERSEAIDWRADTLEALCRTCAEELGVKLIFIAQPLRMALTGALVSPPVFQLLETLGKKEVNERFQRYEEASKSQQKL